MAHINRTVESQDARHDGDGELVIIAQPVSQAEIDELLYSDAYPANQRLERLCQIRDELSESEASDFGFDDPAGLLSGINEAIATLEAGFGESMDPSAVDHNPEDHRETLAPDSEELDAINEEDEESMREG